MQLRLVFGLLGCVCLTLPRGLAVDTAPGLYEAKIKPLLKEKCFTCHGPLASEAGLRLDAIQWIRLGSESGPIATAETIDDCALIERVTSDDADLRMPPEEAGTALNAEQLADLNAWIRGGLPGPEQEPYVDGPGQHWAYRPIERPTTQPPTTQPPTIGQGESTSPIDQLIGAEQQSAGVLAVGFVSDAAWLRRVTYDLIGLPPTEEEIRLFLSSQVPDKRRQVVEQLLARPAYGERWARHWMDVWRYSDWDGYKQELRGSQRHIWHWRDWIIQSLNDNKPYDAMIVEMLAGDEIAPLDADTLRATGFLARNFHKSNRNIWLEATVEHVGKAFLGLTLNCAKCHDHKYDPISQQAYFQFRAIFEPHHVRTDQVAGESDLLKAGLPRAFDSQLDAETFLYIRGDDRRPDKDHPLGPAVPDWISIPYDVAPVELPVESYYPALSPLVRANLLEDKRQAVERATRTADKSFKALKESSELEWDQQRLRHAEHRTAAMQLSVAVADQLALEARYRAETAKYIDARPDGTQNVDAALAQEALQLEVEHRRLAAELDVMQKQVALDNLRFAALATGSDSADPTDAAEKKAKSEQDAKLATATKALDTAQQALTKLATPEAALTAYSPVGEIYPQQSTGRRTALARWIVDPRNPLTARVAVNHMWLRHFGGGLCESEFDFGLNSPTPRLSKLLDWLASELIDSGWDMKHLHRLIVLSDAYARLSSGIAVAELELNARSDPDNRLFWRGNVRRLDAEQVRDSLLAAAGAIDHSFGGPDIDYESGEQIYRRSVYFRHAYEKQMSMLVLFDAASPTECYRRRPSIIPQQALVMVNSQLGRDMAVELTNRLWHSIAPSAKRDLRQANDEFVSKLFLRTLGRDPTPDELQHCRDFLQQQSDLLQDPERLSSFVAAGASQAETGQTQSAQGDAASRARAGLAVALLNHNDFLSVR